MDSDYVIEERHESKPHPMSMNSNYTYKIVGIFTSKESADREIKKEKYKWRGNDTGSVGYKVRERTEKDSF